MCVCIYSRLLPFAFVSALVCVCSKSIWASVGRRQPSKIKLGLPHKCVMGEVIHMLSRGSLSWANAGEWEECIPTGFLNSWGGLSKSSARNIKTHFSYRNVAALRINIKPINRHKSAAGRQQTDTSTQTWNRRRIFLLYNIVHKPLV